MGKFIKQRKVYKTALFNAIFLPVTCLQQASLKDCNFTYNSVEVAHIIFENLKQVSFEGVKNLIVFDSNQDPVIMLKIERIQSKTLLT